MDWHATAESPPEVGEEVLVYKRLDSEDLYAVAHVDEAPGGQQYWDSDSDIVHGCPLDYMSHWCPLSPPAI